MKKQIYDYRALRPSTLGEARFRHVRLVLIGWLIYFSLYFITENLIPAESCHAIHCALDDMIPFCEYFAVFYVGWYFLVFGSLLYTFLYDVERFTALQSFIMITQFVAMLCYILYPSRQDLRPLVFPRDNFLTHLMKFIYAFDTNTGVFPSLHVAYSMGILSVGLKNRKLPVFWKALLTVFVIMICLATAFVKQHSMLDVFAALPVSLLAELIVYGKSYWLPKFRGSTLNG